VGKSALAVAISGALGRPLMRLDAAGVQDKYMGESEKHVRRAFVAARRMGAVLLIDEADTLVSRRSSAQSGIEQCRNSTVNQLIQELNSHDGVVILASNLRDSYDPALASRLTDVHVPAPDSALRQRLWRRKLAGTAFIGPADDAWLAELDGKVAQANLPSEQPFTARDIERVVCMAVQSAAIAAIGPLQFGRREIEHLLEEHLRERQASAKGHNPEADLQAMASVLAAVMAQDATLLQALGDALDHTAAIDPKADRDPRTTLTQVRELALQQGRTFERQLRNRLEALQQAGMPEAASVAAARVFAEQMRATVRARPAQG
jgi:SpoVK/Ycf46/Vps4 family AAA+-type ATPase